MKEPKIIKVPIQSTFSTDKSKTVRAMNEIIMKYPNRKWKTVPALYSEKSGVDGWVVIEEVED